MNKKNQTVEEALFQLRNLEESVQENAKGILASTMRDEIRSLVKESLDDEEDDEEIIDLPADELEVMGMPGDEDDFDDDEVLDVSPFGDDPESMSAVVDVFKKLQPGDTVEVISSETPDGRRSVNLKDTENDTEYIITMNESDIDDYPEGEYSESDEDDDTEEINYLKELMGDKGTETEYEITFGDENYGEQNEDEMFGGNKHDFHRRDGHKMGDVGGRKYGKGGHYKDYESKMSRMSRMGSDEMLETDFELDAETKLSDRMMEAKSFKAKGTGMGNPNKFKYSKDSNSKGFNTKMKQGDATKYTGKVPKKMDYDDEVNMEGYTEKPKKRETKESSRTLGAGKYWGREGLPKPKAAPRRLRKESTEELEILKTKNEEYRNALNVFREKLNEVAVFNSNLAYATRLFTEHSTTKQEKINILKRFDSVESLKESKNLYRTIKSELDTTPTINESKSKINESIERTVNKTPSNGSSVNLIESKTYENPQFLRMKDLMKKL